MKKHTLTPIMSCSEIEAAIERLAEQLYRDDKVREYTALVLLQGGERFFNAIESVLKRKYGYGFKSVVRLVLKSYREDYSTGCVSGLEALDAPSLGGHVMVFDDILDTGCTLESLFHEVDRQSGSMSPPLVHVCVLFAKKKAHRFRVPHPPYCGILIENDFVVGYGLDYEGRYRELDGLYRLDMCDEIID